MSSFTAYPPDFIGPLSDSYRCRNDSEWVALTLNHGDRCWFRKKRTAGCREVIGRWRVGTFIMSWIYDGVIAKVYEDDPDDYIEHSLFCEFGDELRADAPE